MRGCQNPLPGYRIFLALMIALFASAAAHSSLAQNEKLEYRLASGDSIRIQVFQNPDLSLETRVAANGSISFPLIGSAQIGGMTLAEAEQTLARALREGGFIKQPQVIILLQQIRGNLVSVLGQVARPGQFALDTNTTRLSQIIANAGGIAPSGADVIIVTGMREGKPFRRQVDFAAIYLDEKTGEDITLADGDVIYVDRYPVFYVYGEVQRPGAYRIDRNMTVRQALAHGGGLTPRGTLRSLALFRRSRAGAVEELKEPALDDLVRAGDVLNVQQSLF